MKIAPKICIMSIGELNNSTKMDLEIALKNFEAHKIDFILKKAVYKDLDIIQVARELKRLDLDLLVLFPLHGNTGHLQVLAAETSGLPTVIWALPFRYSLPTSASAIGALKDKSYKAKLLYGHPDDSNIVTKIHSIAKVTFTIRMLKKTRIGQVGTVMPPMIASHYDQNVLRDRIGPSIIHVPINDVKAALNEVTKDKVKPLLQKISHNFKIDVDEETLKKALKFHLAVKKICERLQLQAVTFECFTELVREFKTNPCLGYISEDYIICCEGEVVNCATLLMMRYLTGEYALLTDPFALDSNGVLTTINCAGPASLAASPKQVTIRKGVPPATMKVKAEEALCRPMIPPKRVTLLRLYGRNMDSIHVATGRIISCETEKSLDVKIKLDKPNKFIENICGNHYVVASGDIRKKLRILCDWMKIKIIET